MDLLHRYLGAVAIRLPRRERDDIVAELREELLSQVEERQTRLRRMLTADEVIALLKAYGHPFIVAARYRTGRPLVGPELTPFYEPVLVLATSIIVLMHALGAVAAVVSGRAPGEVLNWSLGSLWIVGMYMIGVITFSFFMMDRLGVGRWIGLAWSPRLLPPAGLTQGASVLRRIYDWAFVVFLAGWTVCALYWPMAPDGSPGGNAGALPVWSTLGALLMIAVIAQLVGHALAWARPGNQHAPVVGQMAAKVVVLLAIAMFFRRKPWFDTSGLPVELAGHTQWGLHFAAGTGLTMLAMLALIGLMLDIPKLARAR